VTVMTVIDLRNVVYQYPDEKRPVLGGIDLCVSGTGLTALVGPNGSGKTTLGKMMAGILKPDSGSVRINGRDASEMSLGEIGQQVGYLFQEPDRQLFAPTVQEELAFVSRVRGAAEEDIAGRVGNMLDRFHLSHLRERFPFSLSRGEKQRLVLAAILIQCPRFLILDEPTTALDVRRKAELAENLSDLDSEGVGMLVISHDHEFATRRASRVIELRGGAVHADTRY